jgi:hypothetical protein
MLDKKTVSKLYNQTGLSANEIARKYNISVWRVISFMRRNRLKRRTPAETLKIQFYKKPLTFNKLRVLNNEQKKLLMAGLMLYWAEGSKANKYTVDFANSDQKMVLIFLRMLRDVYQVSEDKFRVYIYCFSNQDVGKLIEFWSKKLDISKNKFTKPYIQKKINENKTGKMPFGLIHIRYSDMKLHKQIMADIGIIGTELLSN